MTRTLGDIASGHFGLVDGPFGSNLPASEYTANGVPIIRGSNLSLGDSRFNGDDFVYVSQETAQRLARSLCGPGDIIFTKKGTLGQTGIIPKGTRHKRYLLSSNQMKLTVDPAVADPLFVYYYVSSPASRDKIRRDADITGVPKTNVEYLRKFPIILPPLTDQRRIAELLGALDDKIELNLRMNEAVEAIVRSIFDESVARTDTVCVVNDVATVNARQLLASDPDEFVDYVEISEVHSGNVSVVVRYSRGSEPTRARRRLKHGDTILSTVRPDRGSYFLALEPPRSLIVSTGFAVISPREVPWTFLHAALIRPAIFRELGQLADGGAYPAVRPETIAALEIPAVSEAELQDFHRVAEPLYRQMEHNRRQSRTLSQLRANLLPRLLSGAIRVGPAENEVAEML